jgi:hypothetical protein
MHAICMLCINRCVLVVVLGRKGEVFCSTSWLVGQGINCAYAQCTLAFDQVSTAGGSAGHPNVPPQGFVACSTVPSEGLVRGLTTTLHLVVQEVCIEWLMQVSGQFWLISCVWQQAVRNLIVHCLSQF